MNYMEETVGAFRHAFLHIGKAESETETMHILHSKLCQSNCGDAGFKDCVFSLSLPHGISVTEWEAYLDVPVVLAVVRGRLVPMSYYKEEGDENE